MLRQPAELMQALNLGSVDSFPLRGIPALVLAAGLGTRLRPFTEHVPKPVIPVLGRPLLGHPLIHLYQAGCAEIYINAFHRADRLMAVTDAWVQRRLLQLRVHWSVEAPAILGTGGALRRLQGSLGGGGPFLLCNGDSILGMDLRALWAEHQQSRAMGAVATLLCVRDPRASRFGAVRVREDGLVLDLNQHARWPGATDDEIAAAAATVFCGVHVLEPSVFDVLPADGIESCVIRDGYAPMMRAGIPVRALVLPEETPFHDVGTVDRYLDAQAALLRCDPMRPVLPVGPGVDAQEALFQEASYAVDGMGREYGDPQAVRGLARAVVRGPVFFGPGNMIGAGAVLGPDLSLGARNEVGAGAVLSDTALWSQVTVADGERVNGELRARLGGDELRAARAS